MARLKKSGRLANADQRELAQEWVDLYAKARASPDGYYCPNPDDPENERVYFNGNDPTLLLGAVEGFARHGTFVDPFWKTVEQLLIRDSFDKLRASGVSYQEAIAQLVKKNHYSDSTIERMVRQPQKVTPKDGD